MLIDPLESTDCVRSVDHPTLAATCSLSLHEPAWQKSASDIVSIVFIRQQDAHSARDHPGGSNSPPPSPEKNSIPVGGAPQFRRAGMPAAPTRTSS